MPVNNVPRELKLAKSLFGTLPRRAMVALKELVAEHGFSDSWMTGIDEVAQVVFVRKRLMG